MNFLQNRKRYSTSSFSYKSYQFSHLILANIGISPDFICCLLAESAIFKSINIGVTISESNWILPSSQLKIIFHRIIGNFDSILKRIAVFGIKLASYQIACSK